MREPRTLKQHKTEWLYYRIISGYSGHTEYEVYNAMTKRFLLTMNPQGKRCVIKPTSLSTTEHNDYLEQIRALMAEFNVYLPEPNERVEDFYIYKVIE